MSRPECIEVRLSSSGLLKSLGQVATKREPHEEKLRSGEVDVRR